MNVMAPVCVEFARGFYCELGVEGDVNGTVCTKRHVYECPEWVRYGKCPKKDGNRMCILAHPKRFDKRGQASSTSTTLATGDSSTSAVPLETTASVGSTSSKPQHQPRFWKRTDVHRVADVATNAEVDTEAARDHDIDEGYFIPFDVGDEEDDEAEDEDEEVDEDEAEEDDYLEEDINAETATKTK